MITEDTLMICMRHRSRNKRKFARDYPELEKLFTKLKAFNLEKELGGIRVSTKKSRSLKYRVIKLFKDLLLRL